MAQNENIQGPRATDGASLDFAPQKMEGGAESAVLQRLLDGDATAFAELVDAYHTRLVRLARSFVKDQATDEDVVQDTWVGVLKGLHGFEGRSELKTWIFRILVNRAKTRAVREARLPAPVLSDAEPAVDPARFRADGRWADPPRSWDNTTPESLLLGDALQRHLREAIENLPPRQRTVLVLRDIEGVSADEVCNILEIAETNQRVMLHRARSALHRALERYRVEE